MSESSEELTRVQAVIKAWRGDDDDWPWAHAEILSDGPTKQAFFSSRSIGVKPELGKVFPCLIKQAQGRWKVDSIDDDAENLPVSFERIQAIVGKRARLDNRWGYDLLSAGANDWPSRRVYLETELLKKYHLNGLVVGATVTVDLEKDGTGYRVSTLHEPLAPHAFPDGDPTQTLVPLVAIAFPIAAWDTTNKETKSNSLWVGTHAYGASVYASVNIPHKALRALGIPAVARATLPEEESFDDARAMIESWTDILIRNDEDEMSALKIDRLLIEVTPAENGAGWSYYRLLGPGTCRSGPIGEIVDWVQATVETIEDDVWALERYRKNNQQQDERSTEPEPKFKVV